MLVCEKYDDDRGPSPLVAELREISENVRKIFRVIKQDEMSSPFLERTKEDLGPILGKKFMGYASGNFEKHKQKGSTATGCNAVDENDETHE